MISLAILVLRLGVGLVFMLHGMQKTFGFSGGPGVAGFSKYLETLNFHPPLLWAHIGAYAEFLGGLLVLLGLFTRPAAIVLFIFIIVALAKVHLNKGFFMSKGGLEYTFILACVCLSLILLGAGKFSIDRLFFPR
jgi:putative oxidoreductase